VDFGHARIGIAVSDELGLLAHPVETIAAVQGNPAARVAEIAREKNVCLIVVGIPRHMSGDVGDSAADALGFADKLRPLVSCEVVTQDERLSTIAANRALREGGRKTRETRGYIDQVAAQMILQTYLDRSDRDIVFQPPSAD
jgi:putative Holliday junction resolvase